MAKIGSLSADLRMQSAAFIRDMGKAQSAVASNTAKMRKSMRAVESASRGVQRSFSQLKSAAGALAGALAVRQFVNFTKAAISNTDAIAKQSRQLQLAATTLQQYRIEGELSGVETSKLESGIGAFVKRVGELRAGTGTLVTILDKSNKALKEQLLAAGDSTEGIEIMLRAIRESGSAFDKQALSAAAFGRQAGQAMVVLAESVGTLNAEMVELVTINDGVLAAGEKLNDQFTLLRSAFSAGFDTAIIQGFSGSVDSSVEAMHEAREIGEQFGRAVGAAMRGVASAAAFVARNMREVSAAIAALIAFKAAAVFTSIAIGVLEFAKAVRVAAVAQNVLNAALIANPIGLIATVVGAAAGALTLFWESTFKVGDVTVRVGAVVVAVWTTISETIQAAVGWTVNMLGALSELLTFDFSGAADRWLAAGKSLTGSFAEIENAWADVTNEFINKKPVIEDAIVSFGNAGNKSAAGVSVAASAIVKSTRAMELQALESKQLISALSRSRKEYEQLARAIEIENDAAKLGVDFTTKQGQAWAKAAEDARRYRQELDEALALEQERAKELERIAQEQRELFLEPFKNALNNIQDAFSTAFENIFSGAVNSFSSLASTVKQIFIKLAAQIATLLIFRPIVGGVLGSVGLGGVAQQLGGGGGAAPGGASLSDLGGLSSLGSLFTGSSAGLGNAFVDVAQFFGAGPSTQAVFGNAGLNLGSFSGIAGGLAGNFGANAIFGNRGIGADIGGTLGAIAGSFIPIPFVGTAIGSFLGNAIGGLFGNSKPSIGPVLGSTILADGGVRSAVDNDASIDQARQQSQVLAAAVAEILRITGGSLGRNLAFEATGQGVFTYAGGARRLLPDLGQALGFALGRNVQGGNADLLDVLGRSRATSPEALVSDLQFAQQVLGLASGGVSEAAQALDELNRRFDEMTERAKSLGLATADLEKARTREFNALAARGAASITGPIDQLLAPLKAFQTQARLATASPGDQLGFVEQAFRDTLSRAQGGDLAAIADLASVGQTRFALQQQLGGFVPQDVFSEVTGAISSIVSKIEGERDQIFAEFDFASVTAINEQTNTLADLLRALRDEVRSLASAVERNAA